jgi:ADP-ribose pyrophosphatase YjhB (NUDIX family)
LPGGGKKKHEYTIEACKRELSEEASIHVDIDLEFAGWIQSDNPRYPNRVCYMLELKQPVPAYPMTRHESEIDMTWLNDYDCQGHAWLTYDQVDRTQYSNDMTRMFAVAYKWSRNFDGVDLGVPAFLGDEIIHIVHSDHTKEEFRTKDIQDWDSFEQFDTVQPVARKSWRSSKW